MFQFLNAGNDFRIAPWNEVLVMLDSRHVVLAAVLAVAACHTSAPAKPGAPNASTGGTELDQNVSISVEEKGYWAALSGTYEIVAVRRATETAAPLSAFNTEDDPRGNRLTISNGEIEMEDASCEEWSVAAEIGPDVMSRDPMLADLHLENLNDPEPQTGRAYQLRCEGALEFVVYKADPRAIAILWDNGASYLIAEKPLSGPQIIRFQEQMIDMKFQSGAASPSWTQSGLIGLRSYYAYRTQSKDAFIFERPAITHSLLEGLGVVDVEQ